MKKTYHIPKSRLYAATDYSAILAGHGFNGYELEKVTPGEIKLATGAVCFFDPYDVGVNSPFCERLPVGKYAVFMYRVETGSGKRVALIGLDGGDLQNAVQWKLALCDGSDMRSLITQPDAGGVFIGSGLAALCDHCTYEAFVRLMRDNEDAFHPLDGIVSLDGSCAQICQCKELILPVCSTGWGEGNYRCYYGLGADGEIKGIVCDFALLQCPEKGDSGETVAIEVETGDTELYIADPRKSDAENNIKLYTAVIESGTADGGQLLHAYSRRGYAYHIAGRFSEALADYLQAIALGKRPENIADFPMHAWSLYDNAARIYRETGRTGEAIDLYREAKDISDTFNSGAYAGLIDVYRENREYTSALAVADEMVAARSHDPAAYVKRSEIYVACEEYEKAIADFNVLIDTFKLSECILDKALCLHYLGRQKEALTVLDGYLIDGRASEIYYVLRAEINMADNNIAAAYMDARNAYDVNPDHPKALEILIELDALFFNHKNIVKWVTRYIELRPFAEYGYSVRAETYMKLGEYADAVDDYAQLVQISKEDPKYCALLIRAALYCGNKSIVKKYQKYLRKADNAYYIYAVGLILMQQGKFARAGRYFASALALQETDIILSALIDCFIESGNYEKADAAMKRLVELADGEEVFAKHARIAKARGIPVDAIEREYTHRFLGDCTDPALTEKVHAYFCNLQ